jgi:hypothetical protein
MFTGLLSYVGMLFRSTHIGLPLSTPSTNFGTKDSLYTVFVKTTNSVYEIDTEARRFRRLYESWRNYSSIRGLQIGRRLFIVYDNGERFMYSSNVVGIRNKEELNLAWAK